MDGDDVAGAALDADDNVWDFGTPSQHPALKAANFDTALQFNSQGADLAPTFDTSTVAAMTYQNGQAIAAFTVPAASGRQRCPFVHGHGSAGRTVVRRQRLRSGAGGVRHADRGRQFDGGDHG